VSQALGRSLHIQSLSEEQFFLFGTLMYLLQVMTVLHYTKMEIMYYTALPRKMTIGLALEFKRTVNVRNFSL